MVRLLSHSRLRRVGALLAVAAVTPVADLAAQVDEGAYYHVDGADTSVSPVAPQFVSPGDIEAFQKMSARASASPVPDPRKLSRAFIREQLGIDGDRHVVAHFATPADRAKGVPDRTVLLTDALMEAFPEHSRHSFFAGLSDTVGVISSGGGESPGVVPLVDGLAHSGDAKTFFARLGRFLWSCSGPGYVYNTFFAEGNVVETVGEDARPLDEAFGVYRVGGFTAAHASPIQLSALVKRFGAPGSFAELPYVRTLNEELDRYWSGNRADWAVLARYEFVQQARHARDTGLLSEAQYALAMRGGAARVPLSGPIALAQLRASPPGDGVTAKRLDINGYAATNLVRFVADDGSEVMYIPGGDPSFVAAGSERELRLWVRKQAQAPQSLDILLSHFALYDGQDGVFWTGVKHGLENLGDGRWRADDGVIDHMNALIADDVFDDMRERTEMRTRDDARVQASTSWEAWRGTINRGVALLAPLGYIPPLAVPIQAGAGLASAATGIDQEINGRTAEERKAGLEQVLATAITNVPVGASFGTLDAEETGASSGTRHKEAPAFVPWQRVNGRLGYPLSPTRPPGWHVDVANRLYRRQDGTPGLWVGAEMEHHLVRLPPGAVSRADGVLIHAQARYVQLIFRGRGIRTARVVADPESGGYRMLLRDGTPGPRVEKQANDTWSLASGEHDYLAGSALAEIVRNDLTADPRTLHVAAHVLAQLGVSETMLALTHLSGGDVGATDPMLALALGHGFLETLPARLRDIRSGAWSAKEVGLVAPIIARQVGRPLALYRKDGRFQYGVSPDGTEFPALRAPPDTLHLRRNDGSYAVLNRLSSLADHRSVFAAVAEHTRTPGSQDAATPFLREADFRRRLADAIEAASTSQNLRRMHRQWMEPLQLSRKQGQILRRISRLRHALVDRHESLTADQERWIQNVRKRSGAPVPAGDAGLLDLLAEIVDEESALLPSGLDHLLVKDAATLNRAAGRKADRWVEDERHFVRLRHLDGRTQLVETGPDLPGGIAEILAPEGDGDRTTGYYVVDFEGMWFPEEDVRKGFAPVDRREYTQAIARVASRIPTGIDEDYENLARIVDSMPQPLLRFVRNSLAAVERVADGSLEFTIEHPQSGRSMTFATHVDVNGQPVLRPPSDMVPPVAPLMRRPDRQLVLPVPEGIPGLRQGPMPDPAIHLQLLRDERPISAFIEAGFADRHVKVLASTRRLRGMLREDTNIAVVGATPEHALTLVMPVNAEALRLVTQGGGEGRRLADLPEGTLVVDDMYGVRATAAEYPARIREVARQWQEAGGLMKRIRPNGSEERESPVDFTERLLATPLRPQLWNPRNDPISEQNYVAYMRRRHARGEPVRHAGLDWLQTRRARRDYTTYFAPPYDRMPDGNAPPPGDLAAEVLQRLAETAIDAGFRSTPSSSGWSELPNHSLRPDAPKEPRSSAGG